MANEDSDRVQAHIDGLRRQLGENFEDRDRVLAAITDDELTNLHEALQQIARNRARGGHTLNWYTVLMSARTGWSRPVSRAGPRRDP